VPVMVIMVSLFGGLAHSDWLKSQERRALFERGYQMIDGQIAPIPSWTPAPR